jgi:hypothetical protein
MTTTVPRQRQQRSWGPRVVQLALLQWRQLRLVPCPAPESAVSILRRISAGLDLQLAVTGNLRQWRVSLLDCAPAPSCVSPLRRGVILWGREAPAASSSPMS